MHWILLNDQLSKGRNTLLEVAYRLKGSTASKTEKETVKESHLKVTYYIISLCRSRSRKFLYRLRSPD